MIDDIRPLKGPVEIKGIFPIWFLVLLLLILILGGLGYIYFRKKSRMKKEPIAPPRLPEEVAMEELTSLLAMHLIKKGMIKEYYIRLSDIVRKYIEGRYRIFALDKTTWELYQEMRIKKIDRAHADKIRDFLEDCDLVKFAKYIPTQRETEETYSRAKEIVEITTPHPNPLPKGEREG